MVNKKNFKIISIITTLLVITTLISLKGVITKADVASRPEFEIEFDKIQDEALVGEDILVTGKIKPKPFEVDIKNMDTEIIIVMDRNTTKKEFGEVINSLRKDIGNFINNIPLTGNVKLGLIDYTNDANIFKYNNNALINISDKDKIANEVYKFKVDEEGYSNTGEALRKTAYLMESLKSNGIKNKIILLFSDGYPTARTVYSNGDAYTDITKEGYGDAQIQTSKSDYTKDIEYAKTIGNKIKENGYTVYTIGYNVETESEKAILRDIYQSMTGDTSDNRFYILPHKKITEEVNGEIGKIFNRLEEDILKSYSLNNIKMNLNLTGDFSLNIDGNTVNLNNINYKLVSHDEEKARYEADPINFEFVLKGKTEGEKQQIFDKVTISYPWKNSIENVDIKSELFITIKSNKLPNIEAKLISDEMVKYSQGEIEVKYEIVPKEFEYVENNNTQNKEVTFIIDTSNDMKELQKVKTALVNQMLNAFQNNGSNVRFNIITYNSKIDTFVVNSNAKDQNGASIDYRNEIQNKINNIQPGNSNEKKLGEAIKEADKFFNNNGDTKSLKNIIIIAAGEPTDTIPIINTNKYKLFTLALDKKENYDKPDDHYNNPDNYYKNPYNKLNEWHKLLGGEENNYFVSCGKEGNNDLEATPTNSDKNPLAPKGEIMKVIAEKIKAFNYSSYIINYIKLNFDLASNFGAVSGLQLENESNYTITLPEIVYTATDKIKDNYYKYESKPIQISFKIKPKNGKTGTLNFAKNTTILKNYLSYKTLDNEIKKVGILTPTVTVEEQIKNIKHGLYNGIDKGNFSIEENNGDSPFEIAQGSTVTFGSTFTFNGSGTEFNLNVDNKFSVLNPNDIKIYKVLKDSSGSTLKELDATNKTIVDNGSNNFKISIKNITDTSTDILVIYQAKIIDGTTSGQALTNQIVFGSTSRNATIVIPQQSTESPILPDLF